MGSTSMETTVKVAELYNNGIKNMKSIATMLNITTSTVCAALKNAKAEGLCNYVPKPKGRSQASNYSVKKKKVICVTTGVIYDSVTDAYLGTNCFMYKVSDCCHNRVSEVESKDGKVYKFEFI